MTNRTAPVDRLSRKTKLIFGLGDWGNTTTATIFGFFFAFFLNNIAGVEPGYAAPVLLLGGMWDAINDPLIGVFADKVRTRWGRRRPFFLIGAIPFSISFILLWWVPPFDSQVTKAIYYTLAYIFFDTAFTFVAVPYTALTPELTEDYDERTRLNGYRMVVSMAGGLIAAVALPMIVERFADKQAGYLFVAIIFGVTACLPYLMLFFTIHERFAKAEKSTLNIFSGFLYTWKNKAFRYAAGIYLTGWVTISLAGSLFQYYVTFWLLLPDQVDLILGLLMTAALVFIPVIVALANKVGKQKAYLIAVAWWMVVMVSLTCLPRNAGPLIYLIVAGAGIGVAAAHVVPWSIVPDVIEHDELTTGFRREGTFYGFMVFLQKTGSAAALAFMQWILAISGYIIPADSSNPLSVAQPPLTLLAIRLLIGPFAAILLAISMFLAWRYPINREKHAEIRAALDQKRTKSR
jgi:GPH family glycoside/pentoside/hexuronide:cation symporter